MGPTACSSKVPARPSQNCASRNAALNTVGLFLGPTRPESPIAIVLWSTPAAPTTWQVLQEIIPERESRFSKNSIWPRSIFSSVIGLSSGASASVGIGWKIWEYSLSTVCMEPSSCWLPELQLQNSRKDKNAVPETATRKVGECLDLIIPKRSEERRVGKECR